MARKTKHVSNKKELLVIGLIVIIAIAVAFILFTMSKPKIDYLATVNGAKIYQKDLDEIALTIPPATRSNITNADLLEQAINFEIISQESEKLGVVVTDADVQKNIEESLAAYNVTLDDLKASLKAQGVDWNTMFEAYRKQMISYQFLNRTILSNITVSEDEMKALYDQYASQLNASYDSVRLELRNTVIAIKGQQALGILLKQKRAEYQIVRYVQYGGQNYTA